MMQQEASEHWLDADLTDYAVAARYDDPSWAERYATKENAAFWLKFSQELLLRFSP